MLKTVLILDVKEDKTQLGKTVVRIETSDPDIRHGTSFDTQFLHCKHKLVDLEFVRNGNFVNFKLKQIHKMDGKELKVNVLKAAAIFCAPIKVTKDGKQRHMKADEVTKVADVFLKWVTNE